MTAQEEPIQNLVNITRRKKTEKNNQVGKKKGDAENMVSEKKIVHYTKQQRMTEQEYLDFCDVKITDDFKKIKNKLLWQTIGKNRDKPSHWVKLKDCDNEHLQNILINVKYIHPITKRVILSLLQERWKEEHKIQDEHSFKDLKEKIYDWNQKGYSLEMIDKIVNHIQIEKEKTSAQEQGKIVINFNKNGIEIDNTGGVMTRPTINTEKKIKQKE